MWTAIFWNVIVQPWTLVRYIIGPISNHSVCHIDFLLRNIPLLYVNLIENSILIVRHICLFWAKNPTALQDDFWQLFLNMIALGFSFITQLVFTMLPGKNPMNFYLCTGEFPNQLLNEPFKQNVSHIVSGIFSFVTYTYVEMSEISLKKKMKETIDKNTQNLFTFTTYGISLILVLVFVYLPVRINTLKLKELDSYPNYILVYTLHHYMPQIVQIFIISTLFYKSVSLRKKVWSETIMTLKN
jgi:hypothetical protein